ncbi:hypothetical protein HanRHA438_Chr13g0609471 [Helianthus annuus]|nr:hypothetical protein HanHA300_Chr13g0491351 [Helianthus annuus]KAJ0482225.1 hypothetical protein HanIR_Chr13g0651511 [Helianthus annuus]KAJ0498513.1 hypothetical protein HanHA89_Chr13g0523471 [Helianthus annuus]KAJ0664528.1 hypothetical protein HanLR1_Chr13g0493471 [Helianthus annuus]KAJ0671979.1 hypothetical protein HanOQP8_Chr13g0491801 [Helianthus annuus]
MMFIPCSLAGMLFPRVCWNFFPLSQSGYILKSSKEKFAEEARYWGAFGLYACISMAYFSFGLSGGLLSLLLAAFMVPAWILYSYGIESLR